MRHGFRPPRPPPLWSGLPRLTTAKASRWSAPSGRAAGATSSSCLTVLWPRACAASVELRIVPGPSVAPANFAAAYASCSDCQTVAVALQIALYQKNASTVAPENVAIALNIECTRCWTVAHAIQFAVPVDDPNNPPENVRRLMREMERELRDISTKDFSIPEADARINAVLGQFRELGTNLIRDRQEADSR